MGRALSAIFGGADDLAATQPVNFASADAPLAHLAPTLGDVAAFVGGGAS